MPIITDWLMVGITFVYVVATIAIWVANHRSASATEKQVLESKRQFDESKRLDHMPYFEIQIVGPIKDYVNPELTLDIFSHDEKEITVGDLQIKLNNIGRGTAKDICVYWTAMKENLLQKNLPFRTCLPGEEKSLFVEFYFGHPTEKPSYDVVVQLQFWYKDLFDNQYNQGLSLAYHVIAPDKIELFCHSASAPSLVSAQ